MINIRRQVVIKKCAVLVFTLSFCICLSRTLLAGSLAELARPHEGRSMRETSTHKVGPDGKFDPNGEPDPKSNWDNKSDFGPDKS